MSIAAARGEVIGIEHVSLVYRSKNAEVLALDNVSLSASDREFVVLLGPSAAARARCSS